MPTTALRMIAQNVNAGHPAVRRILYERRWDHLMPLIRRLVRAGAFAIDLQLQITGQDPVSLYREAVSLLNRVAPSVSPAIDHPDPELWEAVLPHCQTRPLVNALVAAPPDDRALAIIERFHPAVIVLCVTRETTRLTPAERLEVAHWAYRELRRCGIEDDAIYFDAVLFPWRYLQPGATPWETLETIERLRRHFPPCHVMVGLANLTFQMETKTPFLAAFLAMAVAAGLDTVLMDPLSPVLRQIGQAAWSLWHGEKP